MKKNCLTCKYEPQWKGWVGVDYIRRSGNCKYYVDLPVLSSAYVVQKHNITMYEDHLGLPENCPAWKSKKQRIKK